MTVFALPIFREIVDGGLLARFPEAGDEEANRAAVALSGRLRGRRGIRGAIPGARTLLILFDPRGVSAQSLAADAGEPPRDLGDRADPVSRLVRVPVLYGGPDLSELSRGANVSEEEFAGRHAAAQYTVAFLGFAPGFAYLSGLPAELAAARLATPRTRVPAGSVAIGGRYTGVYPSESPGGWRLIGRSPIRCFDAARTPPALFLPGDRVRFEPIDEPQFAAASRALAPQSGRTRSARPLIRVAASGVWTSVQGAPAYDRVGLGVPPGGVIDPEALAAGNAALGNGPAAPGLEMTLVGPELEFLEEATIAFSGAHASPECAGRPVPDGPFRVHKGDTLRVGPLSEGARAYLCVAGGLEGPGGTGISPRLLAGDMIALRADSVHGRVRPLSARTAARNDRVVRVVLGPDEDRFNEEGIATLLSMSYRISAASDRRGIRLAGPPISHRDSAEIPPEGTALGAVQVPPDGQPIVLGPDRPITGGYARVAHVISADFPLLAQAVPGDLVRFRQVTLAQAREARKTLPDFA